MIETAQSATTQIATLKPHLGSGQRFVFSGMGSSYSAIYPSLLRLIAQGVDARMIEASELLYYQPGILTADTVLILVSQSGRSAEIGPLLERAKNHGAEVIGITNTPGSPLYQHSHSALLIQAGDEASVSTKTYTCTLALLHLLTGWLLNESPDEAFADITALIDKIRLFLPRWHEQITVLADKWATTPFIEYVGRGYSTASATTAALISKESIKLPTEGMNSGQFRHGPLELVDEYFTGVLFMGGEPTSHLNRALAEDIVKHGGRLAIISQSNPDITHTEWVAMPDCSPALLPLAEIIPIQLFCGEMSIRKGYEAGQFRYIRKVTVQE
jgi:glutamine---fructose-6-phosphate transaminase (isomerizing)